MGREMVFRECNFIPIHAVPIFFYTKKVDYSRSAYGKLIIPLI